MRVIINLVVALMLPGVAGCNRAPSAAQSTTPQQASAVRSDSADIELTKLLRSLCDAVAGDIGVAVVHVESGKIVTVAGDKKLPLYSVYKLPLAITVLREIEAGKLRLDQKVKVNPADIAGVQFNTDLWRGTQEKTVRELIEYAIVRSDNTSADKLLGLIGGPPIVTQQMRTIGLANIDVVVTSREFTAHRDKPNTGTTTDLAQLLARLQKGELLQPAKVSLLRDYMERSKTGGERRLRANLPAGTQVADKTGTGDVATNDVGLITLPENKGHLAIAVLISGSKLPVDKQEKTIADIARAAYDSFVSQPAPR
nr:classA_beta_lactamase [uncultured bacterium]AIA12283.1 ClassA_beta_lactamase [uncultured bacterium]